MFSLKTGSKMHWFERMFRTGNERTDTPGVSCFVPWNVQRTFPGLIPEIAKRFQGTGSFAFPGIKRRRMNKFCDCTKLCDKNPGLPRPARPERSPGLNRGNVGGISRDKAEKIRRGFFRATPALRQGQILFPKREQNLGLLGVFALIYNDEFNRDLFNAGGHACGGRGLRSFSGMLVLGMADKIVVDQHGQNNQAKYSHNAQHDNHSGMFNARVSGFSCEDSRYTSTQEQSRESLAEPITLTLGIFPPFRTDEKASQYTYKTHNGEKNSSVCRKIFKKITCQTYRENRCANGIDTFSNKFSSGVVNDCFHRLNNIIGKRGCQAQLRREMGHELV